MQEQDLFALLPDNLRKDKRAFQPRQDMHKWDHDVCVYLLSKGYETQSFVTVDGDSFGPLVRGVRIRRFGEEDWKLHTYG